MASSGLLYGIQTEIRGSILRLLPERAAFLESENTLLIADLHLGKINHFRMAGIPLPSKANDENLERLINLLNQTNPLQTIFLGDLFHSYYNHEWEALGQVLSHYKSGSFHLVRGNHDIMSKLQYQRHNITVHDQMILGPLLLTHELTTQIENKYYNISGHLHPGVRLYGKGKQTVTLPCFYFGENQGLLPAFGSFTGLARVKAERASRIYVITDNKVLKLDHA